MKDKKNTMKKTKIKYMKRIKKKQNALFVNNRYKQYKN